MCHFLHITYLVCVNYLYFAYFHNTYLHVLPTQLMLPARMIPTYMLPTLYALHAYFVAYLHDNWNNVSYVTYYVQLVPL